MDYMTIKEAAEKWGLSVRRVQDICKADMIPGLIKFGHSWAIPVDAEKPIDHRVKSVKMYKANFLGQIKKDNNDYTIREGNDKDWIRFIDFSEDEWHLQINGIGFSLKDKYPGDVVKTLLVLNDEDEMVGFIYSFVLPNHTLIPEFMYVKSEYRKMGLGHRLLRELEEISGCTSSMIFYNNTFHDFYKKQGYLASENLEIAMKIL